MNKSGISKKIGIGSLVVALVVALVLEYNSQKVAIKSLILTSPNNNAFQEEIDLVLSKPANVFVRYWIKGSPDKFSTVKTAKADNYKIPLLLLKTDTVYEYQVVIDGLFSVSSKTLSFNTRKQSPWLVYNWVKKDAPHDASSLGNGLVMLCYGRTPGYVAMVDGEGAIRWYWQVDDIGVRAAKLTPKGTILAMLRPPKIDAVDDTPKSNAEILKDLHVPMRRGSLGFAGGTAIAEVDLTGKLLWRIDLDKQQNPENRIIHHDVLMDSKGNIHTLYRPKKIVDMAQFGGAGIDTLGGDGILVMDKTGKELWKWSVWDSWDIKSDPHIKEFKYDRFHMNSITFDKDSNYLVSVAVEDQVWKINAKTGKIMWKFGKNGDFKMDEASGFSFQHSINVDLKGDLMLFDNSLFRNESRGLSFTLDTIAKTATTRINAPLPKSRYTSRMGSCYLLPNGNLLQTSAKTGYVMVTSQTGKDILWELNSFFVPYRAEYVPESTWNPYFVKD